MGGTRTASYTGCQDANTLTVSVYCRPLGCILRLVSTPVGARGAQTQMIYQFAGFELDTDTGELRRAGQSISIAPKAFSVLTYLVKNHDRMVSKSELLDAFWSAKVSEAALQTTISLVRKALQAGPDQAPIIKTLHGKGFRLVSAVTIVADPTPMPPTTALRHVQERRLVSVLYAQISAESDRLAPVERSRLKAEFIQVARQQIEADKGQLIRMMMDGFTVSFGLTPHFEDGARRAAYCAWQLAEQVRSVGRTGVSVSFGIETGTVLNDGADSGWTAPDEIEHRASRLARDAAPGTIHINETTKLQLGEEARCVPIGQGYRLTAPPEQRSGIPARPHIRPTRFVGRKAEHAFLTAAWDGAQSGSGKAVTLSGPAGIGKTRLVSEFLAAAHLGPERKTVVQCLPRLQDSAMAPIRRMCRRLFDALPDSLLEDRLDRALLGWFLDRPKRPDPILESVSDQMRRVQSRALVLRLLDEICTATPLILVFEDTHWMDRESRAYLDELARNADSMALLLLITTRSGATSASDSALLLLSPLGRDESLALLREMPEAADLGTEEAVTLVDRAGGNPFFLEELALALRSENEVRTNLPETVQSVMEVRIADLEVRARTLLYAISVAGPAARLGHVADLLGLSEAEIGSDLAHLVELGFLVAEADCYGFRHALLHDTAYAMIAPDDRKSLHKHVAHLLESMPENEPVRPETLAWHLQQADETEQALVQWTRASQAAMYRSDRQDAISFARNGLSLLAPDFPDAAEHELRLQLSLGTALMAVEGYGSARVGTALDRARVLGDGRASFKNQTRIRAGLWVHTWVAGKLAESIDHAETLLRMARQAEDPALLLQAHAGLGAVLVHAGNLTAAQDHLKAGLFHATPDIVSSITVQNSAVTCAAYASWVAGLRGNTEEMHGFCEHASDLGKAVSNPFARAISLSLCSAARMFVGDVEGCQTLASKAATLSREHHFPFWLGTGLILSGWALGQRGQFDRAFDEIDEGLAVFRATGARVQLANWYGLKADTCLSADQPELGLRMVDQALDYATSTGDIWFVPRIRAVAAALHRRLGNAKEARLHASQCERLVQVNSLGPAFVTTGIARR